MEMESVRIALTAIVLLASLYVVLFRPRDKTAREWAFGVIGLILGHWLK